MTVTGVKGGKEETAGEGGGKEDRGMGDKIKHQQNWNIYSNQIHQKCFKTWEKNNVISV